MYSYLIGIVIILIFILFFEIINAFITQDVSTLHEPISTNTVSEYSKIPKIIHRTWYSKTLPLKMYINAYKPWITMNPDYQMIWNDDNDCKTYMKKFGKKEYKAWKKIIPTSYKADLWRACVLYEYGGVYVDSYAVPFISIDEMIARSNLKNENDIFISVLEDKGGIHNGFIIVTPKHPFIKRQIDDILSNVDKEEENDIMTLTGPMCLSQSIKNELHDDTPHNYGLNDKSLKYYLFKYNLSVYCNITDHGEKLLCKKYDFTYCMLYQKVWKYLSGSTHNYAYVHKTGKVCLADNEISISDKTI